MRTAAALLVLFLLTFGVRYAYVFHVAHDYDQTPVAVDNWSEIAESLAAGRGYAVRSNRTGEMEPTANRSPVYPVFLSLIYRATGNSERAGLIAQCLLDATTALLLVLLGTLVCGRFTAGYLAGLLFCFYYPEWKAAIRLFATPLYVTLITIALVQLWRTLNRPVAREFMAAGIMCGVVALTRATGAFLFPVVLVWLYLATRRAARARLLLLLVVSFGVTMAPWVARNLSRFGEFVPFDTNGGYNLYIGTLGLQVYVPASEFDPALQERLRDASEIEADRILRELGTERVLADPGGHVYRSAKRLVMFFFRLPHPEDTWIPTARSLVGNGVLYLLAFLGWWFAPRGPTRSYLTLLGALTLFTGLLHAQIMAQARLFFPVLPGLAVMAGGGVLYLLRRKETA